MFLSICINIVPFHKLFDTMVKPIITYNFKVWGVLKICEQKNIYKLTSELLHGQSMFKKCHEKIMRFVMGVH